MFNVEVSKIRFDIINLNILSNIEPQDKKC